MQFLVQLIVWGEDFIDFFSEFSLPSQLVGNNLDYLSQKADVTYWIFTFRDSRKYLEEKEIFKKLKSLVSVRITEIDSFSLQCKYEIYQRCIQAIAKEGIKQNCPVIYFNPDCVYSHNLLRKIHEVILKGKRALVYPSLRVKKDAMIAELREMTDFKEKGITASKLLEKTFRHLHEEMKSYFWNPKKIIVSPSRLIWQLDSSVYLYKAFHVHPFCIWAENNVLPTSSIDVSYVYEATSSMEKIEIIKDSSEIVVIDFAPSCPLFFMKNTYYNVVKWLRQNTNANSQEMFRNDFYFYLKPIQKDRYKTKLAKIKKIEKKLFKTFKLYFFFHSIELVKIFFFKGRRILLFPTIPMIKMIRMILRLFISQKRRIKIKQYFHSKKGFLKAAIIFWENK